MIYLSFPEKFLIWFIIIGAILVLICNIGISYWIRHTKVALIDTKIDYLYHYTTQENWNSILNCGYIRLNNYPTGTTKASLIHRSAYANEPVYNDSTYYLHGFSDLSNKNNLKKSKGSNIVDLYTHIIKIKYDSNIMNKVFTRKSDECIIIQSAKDKFYLKDIEYEIIK